jgi:hypothetical protein
MGRPTRSCVDRSGGRSVLAGGMPRLDGQAAAERSQGGWPAEDQQARVAAPVQALAAATLRAALQGRPVSLWTVQKIAVAIAPTPAIPEAVELLET